MDLLDKQLRRLMISTRFQLTTKRLYDKSWIRGERRKRVLRKPDLSWKSRELADQPGLFHGFIRSISGLDCQDLQQIDPAEI